MFSSNTSQVSSSTSNYVEDVFSTYLYTGTGASQTITNNIDTTTYGGLVWVKGRSGATGHRFTDTARGTTKSLESNSTAAEVTESTGLTSFGTSGFTIGADADYNTNAATYTSWTFRKQAKFFDVVTYTGNGANRTIAHNLGSTPGCIIVKRTDTTGNWQVYHNGLTSAEYAVQVNLTTAQTSLPTVWNSTAPTSTVFSVGTNTGVNASGGTYVAYLFAHNAGGFGLANTDNVISCGSFTTSGTSPNNATVNLGYEPQFLLYKLSNAAGDWRIVDNMRGFTASGATTTSPQLRPNLSNAEQNASFVQLTSTGFTTDTGVDAESYIYIAIRRGPMKTPTSGTSVFSPLTRTGTNNTATITSISFPPDFLLGLGRSGGMGGTSTLYDKLRGKEKALLTNSTQSEYDASPGGEGTLTQTGAVVDYTYGRLNDNTTPYILYFMQRAPSFMDVVCYTGTGSARTVSHNLGAVPELMIVKSRQDSTRKNWVVYAASQGNTKSAWLEAIYSFSVTGYDEWNSTSPTSSVFTVGSEPAVNQNFYEYVAYLFASCPGVSKVGTYSGTGATQTISCGFAARFVMIKRTDSTGSWWVWDTARGMVSGTDPRLALNSTAAETNANWVYTNASGFQIVTTDATVNASGGSYIYLSIS